MHYDVVVIGGGPAALAFISAFKQLYPNRSLLVIRRTKKQPIPCAVPYIVNVLGGVDNNLMSDEIYQQLDIDLLIDEVIEIDRERKVVRTKAGREVAYDKLVIATGASPTKIPIEGIDLDNVVLVYKEYDSLKYAYEKLSKAKRIVIVGAGFVGLEFADDLADGREIHVVEILDEVLPLSFDKEFGELARKELEKRGVIFHLNKSVSKIAGDRKVEKVVLSDGTEIKADAVLVAVGVKPNSEIAIKAGLKVDGGGHILVDRFMRTNDPNILAIGDVAQKKDFLFDAPTKAYFATLATIEGYIAAINIYSPGKMQAPIGALPVFATKIGDLAFAAAGLTERLAKRLGIKTLSVTVESINRHPSSLPSARKILFKALFEESTMRFLGAQIAGPEPVVEIMNSAAVMIELGLTAYQILTLQYATHPLLTASPSNNPIKKAAFSAVMMVMKKTTK